MIPLSERDQRTREALLGWLQASMEALGVDSTNLARMARVDESTVNKFIADPTKTNLSFRSITKISDVSPVPPPLLSPYRGKKRASLPPELDLGHALPLPPPGPRDLPVRGADIVGQMGYSFEGAPLGYVERPAFLTGSEAYALRIKDNTNSPVYNAGDMIYVDPSHPAINGDRVVVRLRNHTGVVRVLVDRGQREIQVRTFGCDPTHAPDVIPLEEIEAIHPIAGSSYSRS